MRATGHVIDKERLFRRGGVQAVHVVDGIISHVGDEVVVLLADPWKYLGRVAKQVGRPLVCLAAHEPVEIFEPHADRPLVKWSGRAVQIGRGIMILAEPRRGISVVTENGSDRRAFLADDGIIAGIAGRHFTDNAVPHRMVVAAGNQRCPRRRAQRRRVKLRIAQARLGDSIHVWGRDDTAEGAGHAIALVIGHDQQHVWRALGRHDGRWPVRFGIFGRLVDHAAELRGLGRQLFTVDRHRSAGRAGRARDLLSLCR